MKEVLARGGFSLRQPAPFVAVAEEGSISAASGRLFMSQSAISASVTELEHALGSDLCVRRRAQGVSLTPMGKLVLERAKSLLAEAAELAYLVRGTGTELVGPLVVGCFVTLAPTVLPKLLTAFEEQHPQVTVDFIEGPQDQLREALLSGEIDAAVLYDMGPLEELDRIVLYEARGYAMACFRARGLVPNIRHRTHAYELTRSIVARGLAYAILVQRPANKLSYEGLPILEKEVEPPLPTCPVILAWPRDRRISPRVRALAELARCHYPAPRPSG